MPTLQQRRLLLGGSSGLVTAGLAALWMPALDYFPGITAQTVTDRSGQGNTLTLGSTGGVDANDPAWSQQGLVLNGTSQYATAPVIAPTPPITFMAVTNSTGTTGSNDAIWASTFIATGAVTSFEWRLSNANQQTLNKNQVALIANSTGTDYNGWTAPTVTYDAVGGCAFYRNGVLDRRTTNLQTLRADVTGFYVGATGLTSNGVGDFFHGTISAVAIYNRTLSAAEVARNYRWLRVQLAPAGVTLP